MTVAVLGVVAFIVIFAVSVIIGKGLDKKEHNYVGEDEIKKKKRKLLEKAQANGTVNDKYLKKEKKADGNN